MEGFVMDGIGGSATEDTKETLTERFLGNVSDRTKPWVVKAIDYTLLVILLLLQFMQCSPANKLQDYMEDNKSNETTFSDLYSCSMGDSSSLLYSSDMYINVLVIMTISIGIIIGVLYGAFVWIHAGGVQELPIHPWTEKLYKCTDKILLIDTAIEIPISFYMAPIMTIFLWSMFTACFFGLIFLSTMYGDIMKDDENAKTVFGTNSMLVGLSLFKLTGEVSQYWVLYKASISKENRDKFDDDQKDVGLTDCLLNSIASVLNKESTFEKKDKNSDSVSTRSDQKEEKEENASIDKKKGKMKQENSERNNQMVKVAFCFSWWSLNLCSLL